MRDRIFSSVDLPAPLRPMMPSTSPRLTSKLTSFSAQNSSIVSPATIGAAAQHVDGLARKTSRSAARDHVAQRDIALALGLVADDVFLAEPLGADDDVGIYSSDQSPRSCARCAGNRRCRATGKAATTARLSRKPGR